MEINFYITGDTLVASLTGEIDHYSAEKVRNDIDDEMKLYHAKDLIIDFSEVTFMDSSGVGMVLGRYNKVKELGGKVVIRDASRLVKQILDMSGVFTLMEYEEGDQDGK